MAEHKVLGVGVALVLAAATALTVDMATSSRAQMEADLGDCADAVGTYLTKNFRAGGKPEDFMARSLLSLTNGGQAFRLSDIQRHPAASKFAFRFNALFLCVA